MTSIAALQDQVRTLTNRVISLESRLRYTETVSMTVMVRSYLRASDLGSVRVEAMARSFHVSGQTLRRRLHEEGQNFHDLMNAERKRRCEIALQKNPNATCHDLAEVCGYTEHQSLTRVFHRWFGVTLAEYKRTNQRATR